LANFAPAAQKTFTFEVSFFETGLGENKLARAQRTISEDCALSGAARSVTPSILLVGILKGRVLIESSQF
jgi:hypothetical protein